MQPSGRFGFAAALSCSGTAGPCGMRFNGLMVSTGSSRHRQQHPVHPAVTWDRGRWARPAAQPGAPRCTVTCITAAVHTYRLLGVGREGTARSEPRPPLCAQRHVQEQQRPLLVQRHIGSAEQPRSINLIPLHKQLTALLPPSPPCSCGNMAARCGNTSNK